MCVSLSKYKLYQKSLYFNLFYVQIIGEYNCILLNIVFFLPDELGQSNPTETTFVRQFSQETLV